MPMKCNFKRVNSSSNEIQFRGTITFEPNERSRNFMEKRKAENQIKDINSVKEFVRK